MDPDACFSDILGALAKEDWETAKERAQDLLEWLDKDGFAPGGGKIRHWALSAFLDWVKRKEGI